MAEYELQADAEFVFKKYGSYGAAYVALIATGPNTWYSHYHKNTAKLKDGDLVQFDYAPDYKNYTSDNYGLGNEKLAAMYWSGTCRS